MSISRLPVEEFSHPHGRYLRRTPIQREDAKAVSLHGHYRAREVLLYKAEAHERWTCVVVKRTDNEAFLVTAYPTDAIKEGIRIWPK